MKDVLYILQKHNVSQESFATSQAISHFTWKESKSVEEYGKKNHKLIQWQSTLKQPNLIFCTQLQDSTWQECQVEGGTVF